jgi:hypothetical protein
MIRDFTGRGNARRSAKAWLRKALSTVVAGEPVAILREVFENGGRGCPKYNMQYPPALYSAEYGGELRGVRPLDRIGTWIDAKPIDSSL